MPKLSSQKYKQPDLLEVAKRIKRQATELERIAEFLEVRGIESVTINYGVGLSQALHKISLFVSDADRATLDEMIE
ncbi:hypothetical protein [uncultured Limnobacter sp.]|uniref:hypothetical protein n=1 Tax=uncultured Limnobacter sp. TaxID=199681 RepID=UPI0032B11F10|tara:strand:- start:596 stop:823 length:228 start_codon:yes stop_codon:yes gene_type:complete